METVWKGVLNGTFYGYKPERVFQLSDSSRWEQDDGTDDPGYSESPQVRLLTRRGSGVTHMAVGEAVSMVRVVPLGHGRKVVEL